ncbi:hypothetical protein BP5796_06478 [Coleophoma crateriformis]|uniref:NACHT-NTPase and P-loop NTPases N-terminal domain-containing protein n=1 Tax=Coleophoma crateriformis TaxID=565419 RepID=A0A3D8RNL4_9HELO|nr:hypothetical protein BP5796_06478 [Coleophoma crateriformis]
MAGLELITALGVAASAAQLIDYSLKVVGTISEVYNRAKDAQHRVHRDISQVEEIIELGRAIEGNHILQDPLIRSPLGNILTTVKQLHEVLSVVLHDYTTGSTTRRIWKTVIGSEERRIVPNFERLEKQKTALIVCIGVVHSQTLQTIGNGVATLVERDMDLFKSTKTKIQGSAVTVNRNTDMHQSNIGKPRTSAKTELTAGETQMACPQTEAVYQNMTSSDNAKQLNGNQESGGNANNKYIGSRSSDSSFQVNGNVGVTGTHGHRDGQAKGSSIQINGNVGSRSTSAAQFNG